MFDEVDTADKISADRCACSSFGTLTSISRFNVGQVSTEARKIKNSAYILNSGRVRLILVDMHNMSQTTSLDNLPDQ